MISGTSKISLILDRIHGQIWAVDSVFMVFIIPKYFKTYLKVYGNILCKYIFCKYENTKVRRFSNMCVPLLFCLSFLYFWIYHFILYVTKMRIGNDNFSINKIHKSLDADFISIKKTSKGNLVNPKNISIFQGRESSNIN